MYTFINKRSGIKMSAMDHTVVEGNEAYFIKYANISLPKADWEVEEEE